MDCSNIYMKCYIGTTLPLPLMPLNRENIKNYRLNQSHRNYYVENKIAYTEDHIPVQKLHLFDIPNKLKKMDIMDYFNKNYGQILDMKIYIPNENDNDNPVESKRRRLEPEIFPMKVGYALFANASDATKVLLDSEHIFNIHKFRVQARYSWLQPEPNELPLELESQPAAILNLNDDCLEKVLEYLPLADQIHLARTCTQFRGIFQKVSAGLHKTVDFNDLSLTLWDIRDFCRLSGSCVQHLKCSIKGPASQNICFFFENHLPNLKSLQLKFEIDGRLTTQKVHKILLGQSLLEELELKHGPFGTHNLLVEPKNWLSLKHLKSLKKLTLSKCNLDGLDLSTSIESISFYRCANIDRYLPNILKMQKQVKELGISDCKTEIMKEMITWPSCAFLEVLTLHLPFRQADCEYDGEYEILAQLPSLKKLKIHGYKIKSELFTQLAQHKSEQLEHLEIVHYSYLARKLPDIVKLTGLSTLVLKKFNFKDLKILALCDLTNLESIDINARDVSDDAVLNLISKCTKLFDLNHSFRISKSLIEKIVKQVREDINNGTNQRQLPLKMCMEKRTFDSTENNRDLLSTKEIVHIAVKKAHSYFTFYKYNL